MYIKIFNNLVTQQVKNSWIQNLKSYANKNVGTTNPNHISITVFFSLKLVPQVKNINKHKVKVFS